MRTFAAALAVLACVLAPATAAEAAPAIGGGTVTNYSAVDRTVTHQYVDTSHVIGGCLQSNTTQTCQVQQGKDMTRTVGTDLGASREAISASLSISSSTTVSSSTSCSISVPAGRKGVAYAGGDRYRYHVRSSTFSSATGKTTVRVSTSWSYSFDPKSTLVSCRLA